MSINPRGTIVRTNAPQKGHARLGEPQFQIIAWCPDEKAEMPPEQVHFIMHWPAHLADLPPLGIRFKSPDTLGFFIEELTKYRRVVWPDCEKAEGET